jgi:hypothetical protein
LPPELFNGGPKSGQPGSYLLKGLIWSAIGVSSYLAVRAIHDSDTAMLGAIPLAIGLAYLLYYALEGRKLSQEPNKDETRPLPKG